MTAPGPVPLSVAQQPASGVLFVREVAGEKAGPRPTDRDDLLVLWIGSPGWAPKPVTSGTGGPHGHDLVIPVPPPPAATK